MRYILLISLALSLAAARENPFRPAESFDENKSIATNIVEIRDDFSSKTMSLPSDARVLKYIIIGYQALDGSIKEESLEIDENFDWHESILISKSKNIPKLEESLKRINIETLDDQILKTQESKKEENKTKEKQIKVIMELNETNLSQINAKIAQKESKKEEIKSDDIEIKFKNLVKLSFNKMSVKIHAKDELIRHFLIPNPYKIVLDFKRKNSFYTKTLKVNKEPFKEFTMGSHRDYYRVAILLDGHYNYELEQQKDGIKILLK